MPFSTQRLSVAANDWLLHAMKKGNTLAIQKTVYFAPTVLSASSATRHTATAVMYVCMWLSLVESHLEDEGI